MPVSVRLAWGHLNNTTCRSRRRSRNRESSAEVLLRLGREHGPRLPNLTNRTNWNLPSKETLLNLSLLACPGVDGGGLSM